MRVFISWSGKTSHELALLLRDWLSSAIQAIDPYVSSEDTEKGTRWFEKISEELASSSVGIICLTATNADEPWIQFEAGAISNRFDKARVCVLLFDLQSKHVTGPLAQFQHTKIEKEDIHRLLKAINAAQEDDRRLTESQLDKAFSKWWPEFENGVRQLRQNAGDSETTPQRSDSDILTEVLSLSRRTSREIEDLRRRLGSEPEEHRFIRNRIGRAFAVLSPEEEEILGLYYGVEQEALDIEQIATVVSMSEEHVTALRDSALRKLRSKPSSK